MLQENNEYERFFNRFKTCDVVVYDFFFFFCSPPLQFDGAHVHTHTHTRYYFILLTIDLIYGALLSKIYSFLHFFFLFHLRRTSWRRFFFSTTRGCTYIRTCLCMADSSDRVRRTFSRWIRWNCEHRTAHIRIKVDWSSRDLDVWNFRRIWFPTFTYRTYSGGFYNVYTCNEVSATKL
jgi:hypothetical protein